MTKPEKLLAEQIDDSLKQYMADLSLKYVSFSPSETEQNFSKLEKFCGDIVASLANISALILEVKVNNHGTLRSYKPEQQSGLVELQERGIPVFYSYNSVELDEFCQKASPEDQLLALAAIKPDEQTSKSAITDLKKNLKIAVDNLLNDESGSQDASLALAYFVNPNILKIGSGIESLTTQSLLLIYDRNSKTLASLEKESAQQLLQQVRKHEFHADSKNSYHLSKAIEDFWAFAQSLAEIEHTIVTNNLTKDGRKKIRSNSNCPGKILHISEHHVLQSLGKGSFIVHEIKNLDAEASSLSVGEIAEIKYQNGRGVVAPPKTIERDDSSFRPF